VTISRRDLLLASLSPALARAAAIATDTLDDDAIEKAVARIRPLDPVERSRKLAAVARAHGYERLAPWFDGQTTALERPR
jgi:hypothetical protein